MLSKLTSDILDKIVHELKQDHNMKKINSTIIDPVIGYCLRALLPYLIALVCIFVMILTIAVLILILLIKYSWNVNKLL